MANNGGPDQTVMFAPTYVSQYIRALVGQRVKRWPSDIAVSVSSTARGGDLFNRKRGSIAHSLSLSPAHHPDMTEILV